MFLIVVFVAVFVVFARTVLAFVILFFAFKVIIHVAVVTIDIVVIIVAVFVAIDIHFVVIVDVSVIFVSIFISVVVFDVFVTDNVVRTENSGGVFVASVSKFDVAVVFAVVEYLLIVVGLVAAAFFESLFCMLISFVAYHWGDLKTYCCLSTRLATLQTSLKEIFLVRFYTSRISFAARPKTIDLPTPLDVLAQFIELHGSFAVCQFGLTLYAVSRSLRFGYYLSKSSSPSNMHFLNAILDIDGRNDLS